MEIETLKKDNRKYFIIGSIVVILLASVVFFVGTKAKYRLTQKVNIASGTVNWHPPIFSIVSIKTSSDKTNYSNAASVPTSGYSLSDKSYCEVRGVKDSTATIIYTNGKIDVQTNNINIKCYLYFDQKPLAIDKILATKTIDTSRSGLIYNTAFTDNTTGKMFSAQDDDGTSYFYAGVVNDNWVYFGGFYWRIIRFNGDGSIRMIYAGTSTDNVWHGNYQIGNCYFSTADKLKDNNMYVGYMYTNGEVHGTSVSSYAKQKVDEWYNANLNKNGIKEHISLDAGFCGDRGSRTNNKSEIPNGTGGTGTINTYYAPNLRFGDSKYTFTPTLKCADSRDLYTVSGASKGNKALTYPVGLITVDEIILAAGYWDNEDSYLYANTTYWTMSPDTFVEGSGARVYMYNTNTTSGGWVSSVYLHQSSGLRPVINLNPYVVLSGDGTKTNPYKIV